MIYPYDWQIK